MGAECIGTQVKDDFDGIQQYPPGFAPFTFNFQNVQDGFKIPAIASSNPIEFINEEKSNILQTVPHDVKTTSVSEPVHCSVRDEKSRKSLRNRPSVNYRQFDISSDEDSDYEPFEQVLPSVHCLPKGVFRGCSECENCQKVTARWRPQDASRPVLEDAPVFYPTEEEFKDTLKYIASIRPRAEQYGICRIVPPSSWKPSCLLKDEGVWENSKFATRIQQVDRLQNRGSMKQVGRSQTVMRKRRKILKAGNIDDESKTETNLLEDSDNSERFGFLPGPDFTLESFQKYADEFKKQYFCCHSEFSPGSCQQEPSVADIEGEYWRIVERPTEEIEVLYGADVDTGVFSSGFPRASAAVNIASLQDEYSNSGWNLNNFPRLPGSVLSFESGDISGVLVPWLYVGMCLSSFCWHVEDHHLYSLNYMHWGSPKIWYGVSGKDALRLEEAMKKHLPDLFKEQPDLLHNLVTQFSPSLLKLEGVPVYRCVQNEGEFVLTFPRAYHSGFNCGFNCAEAVNVAPVDWLPHGQRAVELYREQGRKISISHDKLLLGTAREAVRAQWNILFLKKNTSDNMRWKNLCGPEGILAKALKERIEMERVRREHLCSSQSGKMDASFDSDSERECAICHYDLHLSAAKCQCSPDKFACLIHAKQLCSCVWTTRSFLFRYDISELNVLLDALAGKLSAVHRWGLNDLGLSLSSYISKEKPQEAKQVHVTNKEGGTPKDNTLVNHPSRTSDARCSSPKEFDASKPQMLGGLKERNTKSNCLENSRSTNYDSQQPTKSTNLSVVPEQISPVGSLQYRTGSKSSNATAVASSNAQHSSDGKLNASILQTDSKGEVEIKDISVSNLANTMQQTCTLLGDAEVKDGNKLFSDKIREGPPVICSEPLCRLMTCEDKLTSCSSHKDQVLVTPETNASLLSDKEIAMLPVMEASPNNLNRTLPDVNVHEFTLEKKDLPKLPEQEMFRLSPEKASACVKPAYTTTINKPSLPHPFSVKETCESDSFRLDHQHPQLSWNEIQNYENKGRIEFSPDYNWADRMNPVATSSSYQQNNLDRYNCQQKGPRMAKVVRRVSCHVEALEYGVALSGKLWSTSQAIFPKGYRSRVRYFSILDPKQMCYYTSEILDAGLLGPLFMVVVEQCPSEVFIHVSATKCWDMVREKVNDQIRKQHNMGRPNLPPLQPPGSLDGLEMFGFSSPAIIQAVESLDRNFVCTEYWRSRPKPPAANARVISAKDEERNCKNIKATHLTLTGLFKKANPDELHALHRILQPDMPNHSTQEELIHALDEEIKGRRYPT